MEEINKRVKLFLEQKKVSQSQFSKEIESTQQYVSAVLKGSRKVGSNITDRILKAYPDISKYWLLTGEGEMLKNGTLIPVKKTEPQDYGQTEGKQVPFLNEPTGSRYSKAIPAENMGVPIYDVDFIAGDINVFNDDAVEIIGHLNVPELRGSEKIIRARGDSMLGVINERDFIGIKRITDFSFFNYGSPYAIVTENYRLLKFIRKSENPNNIILRSNNPEYDDIELAKDKILELHIIIGVLPFSKIKTFM